MSDNLPVTPGSGRLTATDEVTYSGDTAHIQLVRVVKVTGSEGSKSIIEGILTTATLTNVSASASSVTLKAANTSRGKLVIVNDSPSDLYVKYGATASATSYTYKLGPGDTLTELHYTGIVDGIWVTATGNARVTEITP